MTPREAACIDARIPAPSGWPRDCANSPEAESTPSPDKLRGEHDGN